MFPVPTQRGMSDMLRMFVLRILLTLLCVMTVSPAEPPVTAVPLEEHHIERLGITLGLPAEAYVTGRNVSDDYEPLERLGLTASLLEVELKKSDIYCAAVWFPEDTDMTEIIVTMTKDSDSEAIFRLQDYDRAYLQTLADSYAAFAQTGLEVSARYTEASVVQTDSAAFIRAHGVMESKDASENHLHYMTVANGMRLEITLVEHYSSDGVSPREQRVSAQNELLMDSVVSSLRFDRQENEFVAKNRGYVILAVVTGVLCAGLGISYIISKLQAEGLMRLRGAGKTEPSATKEEFTAEQNDERTNDQ